MLWKWSRNVVVGFTCYVSPMLDEIRWLTWMTLIQKPFPSHSLHRESTAGDSFNNWPWTNMSESQTKTLASSIVWKVPFEVTRNWWILRLLNRSLFIWSPITCTHHLKWSSRVRMHSLSFDGVTSGEETLLAGLDLKKLRQFFEQEPGTLHTLLCKIQAAFSSMLKVHSIDLASNAGAIGFCWFEIQSGWLPSVCVHVSLLKTIHCTWNVNCNWCWNFSFHQQVLLCVCMHTCLRKLHLHKLWFFCTHREHANNYMNFRFWQLPLEVCAW